MRKFSNFACVDWSGEAVAKPKGLAVAHVETGSSAPVLLRPQGGWSREGVLEWLKRLASSKTDIVVGLDLSPALPFVDCGSYFPGWHESPTSASELWDLVENLSENNPHLSTRGFLSDATIRRHFRQFRDCGDLFPGGAGRLRVCEAGQKRMGLSPTSCFNLVGASQVGKSSLTGMRVLRRLRNEIPIWPFDPVPERGPLIVEIYTTIAAMAAGRSKSRAKIRDAAALDHALVALQSQAHRGLPGYDDHSTDAIVTAAWLRVSTSDERLWSPPDLTPQIAKTEGWTFGVV
ncbi:MAG TPA: hypothetical protein VMK31_07060 [Sphingomicrobium sp.]|nr:hypothetical protein [Sphingomicrobium sp.]